MEGNIFEKWLHGINVNVTERAADKVVYEICQDDGDVCMTCYHVFPGIDLLYNDIHLHSLSVDLAPLPGMYEINYCREGRIECVFSEETYFYISPGDLAIGWKTDFANYHTSYFPMAHYHGISIVIYVPEAQPAVDQVFGVGHVDLSAICDRLCLQNAVAILREENCLEPLFSALYRVPKKLRQEYCKVKILEILLSLALIHEPLQEKRHYYTKAQVERIKSIQQHILTDISAPHTVASLAHQHGMALTSLKKFFQGICGLTIPQYILQCRMRAAAKLLRESDESILRIANRVGYANGSKFAQAFKRSVGLTPRQFRLQNQELNGAKVKF